MRTPKMSRCHFYYLADMVPNLANEIARKTGADRETVKTILAEGLAEELKFTNGLFDSGRFIRVATNGKK